MVIMKRALPRRTFLRGLGTAVALPLLEAMVPAMTALAQTAARSPLRVGFVYLPNGANMAMWTPTEAGRGFALSPTLQPLEPFREQLLVLSGLSARPAEGDGGVHARPSATWLSQVSPAKAEGIGARAGTTFDQQLAAQVGATTKLRSLEVAIDDISMVGNCESGFSCTYFNTLCWSTPTTPVPMINNPRVVFEQLFGDGSTPAARQRQLEQDRSILDSITQEMAVLRKGLGGADVARVDEYLDSVRDIEQRIRRVEARQTEAEVELPTPPVGIPGLFEDHMRLMFDLQVLAYQADATRVITFLTSREANGRAYPHIGVVDGHHGVSHHGGNPEKLQLLAKINRHYMTLVAYYLEKLRTTPDGDGSLLDHAMIVVGGCISDSNIHSYRNVPTLLVGGANGQLQGGRHLEFPADVTPLANLFVTMADKTNSHINSFGNSTGRLAGI